MRKNDLKNKEWDRNTSPPKIQNAKGMPTKKTQVNDEEIRDSKKSFLKLLLSNHPLITKLGIISVGTIGLISSVLGIIDYGYDRGVLETQQKQPEIINSLETEKEYEEKLRKAAEQENLELKNELDVSQQDYEKLQESFDSLSQLQTKETSGELELISEPAETKIGEQESAVFFDSLNVSIVDINTDKSPYITEVTVSVNNEAQETFADLKVGDKKIYKYKNITHEVLITSMSTYDVGVTVFKYQED